MTQFTASITQGENRTITEFQLHDGLRYRFGFQLGFVWLLLLTLPLDPFYYRQLFSVRDSGLHFQDLFRITDYTPFWGQYHAWGLAAFTGWLWALLAALPLAIVWNRLDKKFEAHYPQWLYAVRVILRYRLATALLAYGFLLLFPLQVPFPSLSELHTKYGDFLPWKIYYHSLGVSSTGYECTLGFIEIVSGLLLLGRRTAVVGAGIAAATLINVVLANFAYDLGQHVLSVYLLLLAAVLLLYDVPRLYQLLVKETRARADRFVPAFTDRSIIWRRWAKVAFTLFFLVYAVLAYSSYHSDRWPYPGKPGLAKAAGFYNVRHFVIDGQELPYSLTDTLRWQNVVLEQWNTLSIHGVQRVRPNLQGPAIDYQRDYENQGNGGRRFYSYTTSGEDILLVNKNDPADSIAFRLQRPNEATILLDAARYHGHTLHVQLDLQDKTYLLHLGRRKPVTVF
ncbi:hypothetical protein GA0116948_10535 [Chitinophaga costaii]|uniref:DoxX-like family protein n=1 Tax=Chitinophaga costaii TaxID=1335309 RepID=A0A1C4D2I1_9BACT|nr:hypothetical protein [Chitinophaga costaii]PUZ24431.1 hypothetical protein DCM91_10960 [Chitinophaga costaii]SCC25517.1 hypothetical protein GA0116948_10535 [Chitinophaga costaii]